MRGESHANFSLRTPRAPVSSRIDFFLFSISIVIHIPLVCLTLNLQSHEGKIKILSAQTQRYSLLNREATLPRVADLLAGQPVTGAELGAIVSTAYGKRVERK